ncbi:TPA: hypothetical protein DIC38_01980 [Candidatus Nomurabacteria bacterium]|nr:hypothetical protein [Candidatus Nomurabacteria bacterium]
MELALIRVIIAIILTVISYILLITSKITKKDTIKILSPYWVEYLKSNYTLERKLQMKKFAERNKSFSVNLYYLYLYNKTIRDFWKFSKSCAESKEYLSEDAWKEYLNQYLEGTLGFSEREIRLLIALEINKFVEID